MPTDIDNLLMKTGMKDIITIKLDKQYTWLSRLLKRQHGKLVTAIKKTMKMVDSAVNGKQAVTTEEAPGVFLI